VQCRGPRVLTPAAHHTLLQRYLQEGRADLPELRTWQACFGNNQLALRLSQWLKARRLSRHASVPADCSSADAILRTISKASHVTSSAQARRDRARGIPWSLRNCLKKRKWSRSVSLSATLYSSARYTVLRESGGLGLYCRPSWREAGAAATAGVPERQHRTVRNEGVFQRKMSYSRDRWRPINTGRY
jgi:hypothetical protein